MDNVMILFIDKKGRIFNDVLRLEGLEDLSANERQELARSRGYKDYRIIDDPDSKARNFKPLKFQCPDCIGETLQCVMDGTHSFKITGLNETGDFEYGECESEGTVDHWQCSNCGYELTFNDYDKDPDQQEQITENAHVVQWLWTWCRQD